MRECARAFDVWVRPPTSHISLVPIQSCKNLSTRSQVVQSRTRSRTPQAVVRPLSACQQSFDPASRAHCPAPPHTASEPSCDRAEGRKLTAVCAPRSVRRPSRRAHPAQDCLPGRQRRWLGLCVALSGSSRAMTQILTSVDTQRAWLPSSTSTPRCALGLCGPFGREDSEG